MYNMTPNCHSSLNCGALGKGDGTSSELCTELFQRDKCFGDTISKLKKLQSTCCIKEPPRIARQARSISSSLIENSGASNCSKGL
jgi:hypothetical protein